MWQHTAQLGQPQTCSTGAPGWPQTCPWQKVPNSCRALSAPFPSSPPTSATIDQDFQRVNLPPLWHNSLHYKAGSPLASVPATHKPQYPPVMFSCTSMPSTLQELPARSQKLVTGVPSSFRGQPAQEPSVWQHLHARCRPVSQSE